MTSADAQEGNPDAKRLYDDLISRYNKLVRPVINVSEALTVSIKLKLSQLIEVIVRVHYFVRGEFVGHRSRASSKHLSPHLPVDELDSSGSKRGCVAAARCTCGCRVHKEAD
ncbi:acetylcholine receptor subunit alpha-like [Trichonephila clavipes]|nr:acetylcholine receptor subunit alpha-like [Trichonephila clavipes]